jgi:DNA-binding NarL/FixJ family response regulator
VTARTTVGSPLTARQREVVTLVADGRTNPQIAATLGISVSTVKTTLEAAMFKLGAYSRWHAIVRAAEAGELR